MESDKKQFSQKLNPDIIEKFDECLKLKNDQLSLTGSDINKGELLEEMIDDYYKSLKGITAKADENNKVIIDKDALILLVQDAVKIELKPYSKLLSQIAYNTYRVNKLSELLIRTSCGTSEELVGFIQNKDNITRREAEEKLSNYIANDLFQPCPYVEAVDSELFNEEGDEE